MSFRSRKGSFARALNRSEWPLEGDQIQATKKEWFFEVAWEVANKGQLVGHSAIYITVFTFTLPANLPQARNHSQTGITVLHEKVESC